MAHDIQGELYGPVLPFFIAAESNSLESLVGDIAGLNPTDHGVVDVVEEKNVGLLVELDVFMNVIHCNAGPRGEAS